MGIIKKEIKPTVIMPSADSITLTSVRSKDFLHDSHLDELTACVSKLFNGTELHYNNSGKWCLHELIKALCLQNFTPCIVRISSWMITEEPARQLLDMCTKGLIASLILVLDERIMDRRPKVISMLKSNSKIQIAFAKVHAKVCTINTFDTVYTIIGSANLTRNPRIEAGVVSTSKQVYDFHCEWLTNAVTNYEDRIHARNATGNRGVCSTCLQNKGNCSSHTCRPSIL